MAKTTKSQARTKRERSEFLWGWLFILPTTIGLIVLNIIPIFQTIYQSFFKTGDFGKGNIFIGLQNYQKVFADKEIWQALINTFKYAIVEVPFSIAIALVLAVLLNRKMKGRSVYITIIFLRLLVAQREHTGSARKTHGDHGNLHGGLTDGLGELSCHTEEGDDHTDGDNTGTAET